MMPITNSEFENILPGDKFITEDGTIWTACTLQWLLLEMSVKLEYVTEAEIQHNKLFAYTERNSARFWEGWITSSGKSQKLAIKSMLNKDNKPARKHSALIKLWADGAIIQSRYLTGNANWKDAKDNEPSWSDELEYRVKPPDDYEEYAFISAVMSETTFTSHQTPESNVRMIFDGETKKLKYINTI